MSGIYIHIPFCKKACHYCNFHFSTSLKHKRPLLDAIIKEIELRADYLTDNQLTSIYFGGGTPSLLSASEVQEILDQLSRFYQWESDTEITIETNPDDITQEYLDDLYSLGVNRLSVGIQSFDKVDLEYMNRAHNEVEAVQCLELIKSSAFDNYTLDLIYGSSTTSDDVWKSNVEKALSFQPDHISAYCLTIEDGTAMGNWLSNGKIEQIDDDKANRQFEYLVDTLHDRGYEHYEISNFARKSKYAIHNTNYWMGKHYLGLGPAAHSYNTSSRSWNIANNAKYIKALQLNQLPLTSESLSADDVYNETIMTGLRTMWGVDLMNIQSRLGNKYLEHFTQCLSTPWMTDKVIITEQSVRLSKKGKFFADKIASLCFI